MNKLLQKINKLHVNYNVLSAGVLHSDQETQNKVNNLIMREVLKLPESATDADLKQKRQIMVDDVDDYGVILDVFQMLKRVVAGVSIEHHGELIADAEMLIKSIEDER